ncbi:MAG TPA: L-threonylcarbamoyladenylate synthase [Ktedonobacterales bacterium]|nr:L-threonylcarbamoyladenylate synthase [Ktedonobacterales bacterium]
MPERTIVLPVARDGTPTAAIARAAALLRAGGLVAFPTETVYGLGADATAPAAVEGIFHAKQRPHSDPLIVHVAERDALPSVVRDIPDVAWELARRFWPGPLTLVLPRADRIPALVAAGGETLGVRVPDHAVARALIRAAGVPVAAPSANRFTRTSPTMAAHVLADLDGRIDCVLDAGPCAVGVESTVLDLTVNPPRILRPGGVTLEALCTIIPDVRGPAETTEATANSMAVARAPGQMERHYAPRTRLIVFDGEGGKALNAIRREAVAALARGERVGALLPDEEAGALAGLAVTVAALGSSADLGAISRRLYAALRELDERRLDLILAHTFGREGLGLALWDRLRRAAGGELRAP